MKNVKKVLVFIIILLTLSISTSFADTGVVNTAAVRIRKEASTSSDILTNIYEDDEVEILETLDSGWYKVKYKEYTGYVKKEYLTVKTSNQNTNKVNNTTNTSLSERQNNTVNNASAKNVVNNTSAPVQNNTVNNSSSADQNNIANNSSTSVQDNTVNNSAQNNEIADGSNFTTNSETNVRLIPNIMSKVITVLPAEKNLTSLSQINNWVKITDGEITGWILKNKLLQEPVNPEPVQENNTSESPNETKIPDTTQNNKGASTLNKKGKINVETANVREKSTTSSEIIGFLDYGDEVTITLEEGDWYKITSEDVSGYVSKRLINIIDETQVSSRKLTEERIPEEQPIQNDVAKESNIKGEEVVQYAKQYLNYPYVVGGKKPETGFDCSGFTRYVFLNFGYSLGSTADLQKDSGTEVLRENLELGDLILFYDEEKSKIGHTGIYIGNSEFIHSANPSRGVVIDNLDTNSYYNERFVTARRIV